MKKPRILVVGSLVMDLIVSSHRFPASGETVIGCGFQTAAGGKGANQAVQAARLGAAVTMVGKVGQDRFGQELLESVRKSGVDVSHVIRTAEAPSAVGNVQLEVTPHHAANRIVVVPGANMCITKEDVAFLEKDITHYDMVILQMEIPMEINQTVIRYAHRQHVPVMLNVAPYAPVPPECLSMIRYISPNEHEATDMAGVTVTDESTARQAISRLMDTGVEHVIITMGRRGAAFGSRDEFFVSPCIPDVLVQDPTAAGDSFVGAFCTGVCCGLSHPKAMEFANYTASLTVSRMGAQPSLPTIEDVVSFMKKRGADTRDLHVLLA